jgi:hypothetical protein
MFTAKSEPIPETAERKRHVKKRFVLKAVTVTVAKDATSTTSRK